MPVAPERVARAFGDIEKLVATDSAAAREALAGHLEPFVLRVGQDGGEEAYETDTTLKRNLAALASGRGVEWGSCGGPRWSKADLIAFTSSLRS